MYKDKKVVSMIPIKLKSERVKEKNIRKFCDGTPLLRFIIDAVLKSKYVDEVYVYCSDDRINDYIPDDVKFLKRPSFLDGDSINCNDIIREFISEVKADIYSVNHATAPFTNKESIDRCVEIIGDNQKYDSVVLVKKLQTLLWNKDGAVNFNLGSFPRTQDLEPLYMETSGAHVFSGKTFKKYDNRYGDRVYYLEVSEIEGLDIDTEEEMIIAQALYKYRLSE